MRLTLLFVPAVASMTLFASCGGDSSSSTADEAFCQEIEQLETLDIETDISKAAEILSDLATKAPNPEVRNALEVIAPIFEQLGTIDQSDASAMGKIFELMQSAEVTAASEVLDKYGSEVCGFDDSGDSASSDTAP